MAEGEATAMLSEEKIKVQENDVTEEIGDIPADAGQDVAMAMENETLIKEKEDNKKSKKFSKLTKCEKKERKRPNCFLSIPITNKEVLEGFSKLMQCMLEVDADIKKISIPIGKIHLTLGVFNLETDEQIDSAKTAMAESLEVIKQSGISHPISMNLKGLGSFHSGVLFVKVEGFEDGEVSNRKGGRRQKDKSAEGKSKEETDPNIEGTIEAMQTTENEGVLKEGKEMEVVGEVDGGNENHETVFALKTISKILLENFEARKLADPTNSKDFKAHITVAKTSKVSIYQKRRFKSLIKKVIENVAIEDFGCQLVERVDLCWMTKMDELENGYKVIDSINLTQADDSDEGRNVAEEVEEREKVFEIDEEPLLSENS